MTTEYICFDTIIGPTYHYGGLALGNTHSLEHKHVVSNPKKAALQGLAKMKLVLDHGVSQYVLPSYNRDYKSLIQGYYNNQGNFKDNLKRLYDENLDVFSSFFSASSAWLANAWTMTPSCDSYDKRYHATPASLKACFHRSLDVAQTSRFLRQVFDFKQGGCLHEPLTTLDEGAANMIRLSDKNQGLYLFVSGSEDSQRFSSRHEFRSWKTVVKSHQLNPDYVFYLTQHPEAIDAGVFHNDVIAFGLDDLLVVHEYAFLDQENQLQKILDRYQQLFKQSLKIIEVPNTILSLDDAVESYFFNSQLIRKTDGSYLLIVPSRCKDHSVMDYFKTQLGSIFKQDLVIAFCNVDESIKNGGGPACLRNFAEWDYKSLTKINPEFLLTKQRYDMIANHIERYYPNELKLSDFLNIDVENYFRYI